MAQSRLERIGTIYSRISSLIKGGAMKPEDTPLWYDVYRAFPPKLEPRFDRAAPNIEIRDIFYKEDVIRAKFQRDYPKLSTNLQQSETPSQTQRFIAIYNELEENRGNDESNIYEKALEKWAEQTVGARMERAVRNEEKGAEAAEEPRIGEPIAKPNVQISDIFKD